MVQDKSFDDHQSGEKDILDLKAEPASGEETVSGDTISSAASGSPEPAADAFETADRPSATGTTSSRTPSSAAMIGTGILGGLIALAAAGSMQYAGYLPGLTAEKPAEQSSEVQSLRAEIDGLKQQLATIPADLQPSTEVEKRLAALEQRPTASAGTDAATASRLAAIEEQLKAFAETAAKGDSDAGQKIATLTTRLEKAETTLQQRPGEAAVSRTIAATYLKAAVDRGDPFLTELETFATLAPDDPAIAELKPMAAAGIRSKAALTREFDDVARLVTEAINQPVAGQGWTDRLLSSARSLVSIRPVGNVEGTDAGAVLARLEDKLKNGDLKGAALEWEALPEPARKVSTEFKGQLDNRIKADELTGALVERSKSSAIQAG